MRESLLTVGGPPGAHSAKRNARKVGFCTLSAPPPQPHHTRRSPAANSLLAGHQGVCNTPLQKSGGWNIQSSKHIQE